MPSSNSEARKRHDERLAAVWEVRSEPERVIGLSGWAQSGKDSMGDVLVTMGFEKLAFADGLREMAYGIDPYVLFKFEGEFYRVSELVDSGFSYEWLKAETTFREFLQETGTRTREVLGEDCWVNALLRKMQPGGRYVVTDVRFPNEADAIRNMGGVIWRIERSGHQPPNDHISERALDDYSFDRVLRFQDCGEDMAQVRSAMRAVAASVPEVSK